MSAAIICGPESMIACTMARSIVIAAWRSVGAYSVRNAVTAPTMASSAVGAYSIAICATVPMSDMTDAPSVGAYPESEAPICSTADGSCSEIAAIAAPAMTAMRGTMFDAAVVTESTS